MTLPIPERKQWFLDRIGTRVWTTCDCKWCQGIYQYGKLIRNENDALFHYNLELSNPELSYFETKTERDEHESKKH